MASKRKNFDQSGPLHLTSIDWQKTQHQWSVAACLVKGVYVVERDRQEQCEGPQACAPSWWEFFHFKLVHKLVDDADFSIFGAIYEFIPPPSLCNSPLEEGIPRFVIAFRGNLWKPDSVSQDLKLNFKLALNRPCMTTRFKIAVQAVRNKVREVGDSKVWLAGHSLGSAVAMHAGKTMAREGIFLKSFLFNPPFVYAPLERIKDESVNFGIRFATNVISVGLAVPMKAKQPQQRTRSEDTLSAWFPSLFIHPADVICSEYIGYFEHRKKMEDIGAGDIERLAAQTSLAGLLMHAMGKQTDSEPPLHHIPSANLTVNLTPSRNLKEAHGIHQWFRNFKEAHGIEQWWRDDLQLRSEVHKYR